MATSDTLRPKRFLVTAGNTREKIDQVRDWGNIFTGKTGLSIAMALANIGQVDLVTSNTAHLESLAGAAGKTTTFPIRTCGYVSHDELKGALSALMSQGPYAGVFMTAAVADYKPAGVFEILQQEEHGDTQNWVVRCVQAGKVSSSYKKVAVIGQPTEKLVDLFRTAWGHRGLLVKFKLEVGISRDDLLRVAEASRTASGADYLVANTLDMVQGDGAGAFVLSDSGHEWVPRAQLPERLLRLVRP